MKNQKIKSEFMRFFSVLITVTILAGSMPVGVFAQAVEEISESTPAVLPTIVLGEPTVAPNSSEAAIDISRAGRNTSARQKLPSVVRKMTKKSFRSDEKIEIRVDNAASENLEVEVANSRVGVINADTEIRSDGTSKVITVYPERNTVPGLYQVTIIDGFGGEVTQDFSWGVLAINPNKSVYYPDETANFAIGILDDFGVMVCDAEVELKIENQELEINESLTTENGLIKVNPECQMKKATDKPDYEASFKLGGDGEYKMSLTALTPNGQRSITDTFKVDSNAPFSIERITGTRIFPYDKYDVRFKLTAKEDFSGTIRELVPSNFRITPLSSTSSASISYLDSGRTASDRIVRAQQVLGASFGLVFPFEGLFPITQIFGNTPDDPYLATKYRSFGVAAHDGVDFALPIGTPVKTIDDGKVLIARENFDYGTTIIVEHTWGRSYYGHLSELSVVEGQEILQEEEIGLSGNTGLSTGPHLHFGIRPKKPIMYNGYYGKIDPLPYFGTKKNNLERKNVRYVSWQADIKAGEEVEFGYEFDAPDESPQFYNLGPLTLINNDKDTVFSESRRWMLAIDAIALVQSNSNNTFSISLGTNPTAGNMLIVLCAARENATITGPTNFSTAVNTAGTMSQGIFYKVVESETTATTFTCSGPANPIIAIAEYSGLATSDVIDGTPTSVTGTSATPSSGNVVTSNADDLLFVGASQATNNAILSYSDSFAEQQEVLVGGTPSGRRVGGFADRIVSSTGTYSTTVTFDGSSTYRVQLVAFKQAASINMVETRYRWRSDDGNETTGTPLVDEDTQFSDMQKNTTYRVRFQIQNSGSGPASAYDFTLEYAAQSGSCAASSYSEVPDTPTSEPFDMVTTTNYTDGAASTNVVSGPGVMTDPGGSAFTAGQLIESPSNSSTVTVDGGEFTEIEFALQANDNAADGANYCFRLTNAGTPLNTYDQYAMTEIFQEGPELEQMLRHGAWFSGGEIQPFTW